MTTEIRLTSHNLPGRVGRRAAAGTIADLVQDSDVLVLQEARAHHAHLEALSPRWETYIGRDPALTISWRKSLFRLVSFGAVWAYDDTPVGQWGAGPSTLKACWNPVVTLEVRASGERLQVMDAHLAPSVTRRRPVLKSARASWEKRRELFALEVAMIARQARASRALAPFVVAGDFNAEPSFPLLQPLRDAHLQTVRTSPTHGKRQIDLAWARGCTLEFGRVRRTPSDHHAVTWRIGLG